ncbi:MAG: right-handed parallel beta-helix repeat-containing protein [Myxococcota bacterium]
MRRFGAARVLAGRDKNLAERTARMNAVAMLSLKRLLLLGLLPGWVLGCGSDTDLCAPGALQATLDAAQPGEAISVAGCTVDGPLILAPGISLRGSNLTIRSLDGIGVVIEGAPGSPLSELSGVEVEVTGRIGIAIRGATAELRDVGVRATQGVGVAVVDGGSATLRNVEVHGPVTRENANALTRVIPVAPAPGPCPAAMCECEPGQTLGEEVCDASGRPARVTATYGLYASGATLDLENVRVKGFAEFGAAFVNSIVSWDGGSAQDNLGIGIRQAGGSLSLQRVEAEDTLQGLRGAPAIGIAVTDSTVSIGDIQLRDNDRYGFVGSVVSGEFLGVGAERNGDVGFWLADSGNVMFRNGRFSDNSFAGLVLHQVRDTELADSFFDSTLTAQRSIGVFGMVDIGDGVHITAPGPGLVLSNVTMENNARAGLVAEEPMGGLTIRDVTVNGTGSQLGAVSGTRAGAQIVAAGASLPSVTRLGATGANDSAFAGMLDAVAEPLPAMLSNPADLVGLVMPMF